MKYVTIFSRGGYPQNAINKFLVILYLPLITNLILLPVPLSFAQQIIPDGQTQTQLNIQGATTDITTATIQGDNAFNSFSKFDVYQGNTVNLHLPHGTQNLLNLVL